MPSDESYQTQQMLSLMSWWKERGSLTILQACIEGSDQTEQIFRLICVIMSWWRNVDPWLSFKPAVKALIRLSRFSDWSLSSCHDEGAWIIDYPSSLQWRLWSDWGDFQTDLCHHVLMKELGAWTILQAFSEGSDQTDQIFRLICVIMSWWRSVDHWLSFKPAVKALIRLRRFSDRSVSSCLDEGAWSLDYPSSLQWRLWSDWSDFQTDLCHHVLMKELGAWTILQACSEGSDQTEQIFRLICVIMSWWRQLGALTILQACSEGSNQTEEIFRLIRVLLVLMKELGVLTILQACSEGSDQTEQIFRLIQVIMSWWRQLGALSILQACSEGSDQTGQIFRLIWVIISWWRSLEPWLSFKPAVKALIRLSRFLDWSESSYLSWSR